MVGCNAGPPTRKDGYHDYIWLIAVAWRLGAGSVAGRPAGAGICRQLAERRPGAARPRLGSRRRLARRWRWRRLERRWLLLSRLQQRRRRGGRLAAGLW